MGVFDIPPTIDFIISKTSIPKLTYVGHSQGATQLISTMSISSNMNYYNRVLNGFVALGPVTNLKYTSSKFVQLAVAMKMDKFIITLGINEFMRVPEDKDPLLGYICKWFTLFCDQLAQLISDIFTGDNDHSKFVEYMFHFPAGTSTKSISHFAQIHRRGEFIKYDNGYDENYKKYKQPEPPVFNVELIRDLPICMMFGADDRLSEEKDNRWIKEKFESNSILHFYKKYDNMGHLTYFLAKDDKFIADIVSCANFFNNN